jgi:hypothetical protein
MKKAFYYVGIFTVASGCLATTGVLVTRQQTERRYRQRAAQDEMRLPSESQRLMQLADTLDAKQRTALLRQCDMAALFAVSKKYPTSQNGFVGPTPQRLEVVFKQVTQDDQHPGLYRVDGLTRTKGAIRILEGSIQLQQVRYAWEDASQTYIATGTFRFTQPAYARQAATTWQGLVAVDFEVKEGRAQLFLEEGAMLPVSRGFAFEGKRATTQAKQPERVIWAANFGPLGSSILEGFGPGGRSEEVAPRYRKYGWDKYWENDEWWADSPKPSLDL